MNAYTDAISKYADFKGRSTRSDYWLFVLLNLLITFGVFFLDAVVNTGGVFALLYGLFILIPSFSVTVRRLHDAGLSGWWVLLSFFPFIGALVMIALLVQESDKGTNKYGPHPKEPEVDAPEQAVKQVSS